jgi:hypothetical protein
MQGPLVLHFSHPLQSCISSSNSTNSRYSFIYIKKYARVVGDKKNDIDKFYQSLQREKKIFFCYLLCFFFITYTHNPSLLNNSFALECFFSSFLVTEINLAILCLYTLCQSGLLVICLLSCSEGVACVS